MSDAELPLRMHSKLLFGSSYRLQVSAHIARHERVVSVREVARELGVADSIVRSEFLRLAEAGLLLALPRTGPSQYYERLDSPFWEFCATFERAATVEDDGSTSEVFRLRLTDG
jgi:hypothetical protein